MTCVNHSLRVPRARGPQWRRGVIWLLLLGLGWSLHRWSYPRPPGEALMASLIRIAKPAGHNYANGDGAPPIVAAITRLSVEECVSLAQSLLHSPLVRYHPDACDALVYHLGDYARYQPVLRQRLLAELVLPAMKEPPREWPRLRRLLFLGTTLYTSAEPMAQFVTYYQYTWCQRAIQYLRFPWHTQVARGLDLLNRQEWLARAMPSGMTQQLRNLVEAEHLRIFVGSFLSNYQASEEWHIFGPGNRQQHWTPSSISASSYQALLATARGLLLKLPEQEPIDYPDKLDEQCGYSTQLTRAERRLRGTLIDFLGRLFSRVSDQRQAALACMTALQDDWAQVTSLYPAARCRPSPVPLLNLVLQDETLRTPELMIGLRSFGWDVIGLLDSQIKVAAMQLALADPAQEHQLKLAIRRHPRVWPGEIYPAPALLNNNYHNMLNQELLYREIFRDIPEEYIALAQERLSRIMLATPKMIQHYMDRPFSEAVLAHMSLKEHGPFIDWLFDKVWTQNPHFNAKWPTTLMGNLARQGPLAIRQEIMRRMVLRASDPKYDDSTFEQLWVVANDPEIGNPELRQILLERWHSEWSPEISRRLQPIIYHRYSLITDWGQPEHDMSATWWRNTRLQLEVYLTLMYPELRSYIRQWQELSQNLLAEDEWALLLGQARELLASHPDAAVLMWQSMILTERWPSQNPRELERLSFPYSPVPESLFSMLWTSMALVAHLTPAGTLSDYEQWHAFLNICRPFPYETSQAILTCLTQPGGDRGTQRALGILHCYMAVSRDSSFDLYFEKDPYIDRQADILSSAMVSDRELIDGVACGNVLPSQAPQYGNCGNCHLKHTVIKDLLTQRHCVWRRQPWREPEPRVSLEASDYRPYPIFLLDGEGCGRW